MVSIKKIAIFATVVTLFATSSYANHHGEKMSKEDMIKEGRKVFVTKSQGNCLACHSVQGDASIPQTGTLGPRLANMDTYPKEYLIEKIMDPNITNPTTIMPPLGRNHKITKAQVEAVVVYLQEITKAK